MPKWTCEQENAIKIRGKNLLVSAAAGSGKTAVLVERIIRMLVDEKNPVDIDKIVVVTFTNAAANQMKDKIYEGISKTLAVNPANERLIRALSLVHCAKITTIDSFCLEIIKENFSEINLEPSFRVIDAGELGLLKADVMEELLLDYYDKKDSNFHALVKKYSGGKNDSAIEKMIFNLYETSTSFPWPEEWLDSCIEMYDFQTFEEFCQKPIIKDMLDMISSKAKELYDQLSDEVYGYEEVCSGGTNPEKLGYAIKTTLDNLKILMNRDYIVERTGEIEMPSLPSGKLKSELKPFSEALKPVREWIEIIKRNYFKYSLKVLYEDEIENRSSIRTLVELTKDFSHRLTSKKREKNVIDFVDMEHLALEILVKRKEGKSFYTQVADLLANNYSEIFVDEYQDSNEVQETILYAISKERLGEEHRNLFMVGDVKQSIYKFRMARPELFTEKYNTYWEYSEECVKDCVKVELNRNFRSGEHILASVNDIFKDIMKPEVGNIDYNDKVKLNFGRDSKEFTYNDNFATDVYVIDSEKLQIDGLEEEEADYTKCENEAVFVANKIAEIIDNPDYMIWDAKENRMRTLMYRDIVILMRSTKNKADTFVEVLSARGIPAFFNSDVGYFSAKEIKDVLNFLTIIDNPRQDIAFAGCMLSYFGGFDANELARIKSFYGDASLFECVRLCADKNEEGLSKKCYNFLENVNLWRQKSTYMSVGEMVYDIVYNTGYYEYMELCGNEKVRKSNLDILANKAKIYEKTSYVGLFNFLRYIEKLNKYQVDYSNATTIGEYDNLVRIMSIHHSKGLEFPIVFVTGLGNKFNNEDIRKSCAADPDLKIAIDRIDLKERTKKKSLFKTLINDKIKRDNRGEELRVLYVALTRAMDKLILVGTAEKLDEDKWTEVSKLDVLGCCNYLEMIMPSVLKNVSGYFKYKSVECFTDELEYVPENVIKVKREYIDVEYPYADAVNVKSKYSVSEIKHGFEEEMPNPYVKEEISDTKLSSSEINAGAKRGTAYHKIMELLDYNKVDTLEAIKDQIEEFDVEYKEYIDPSDIFSFCKSELGKRIKKAFENNMLYREQPFVMGDYGKKLGIPYLEDCEEFVLVQGVIDLFFFENNEVVLLDYKTDNVKDIKILANRYDKQLKQYKKAISKALNVNVKETCIYSFAIGKTLNL